MANSTTTLHGPGSEGVKFNYQSQNLGLDEWVNLLTLCLAPVLAHILTGSPRAITGTTSDSPPTWLDRIALSNPTSIVWRYYAVTDRRVRTPHWSGADMVAANTAIWSGCGWHNSQSSSATAAKESVFFINDGFAQQQKRRVALLSVSALKSLLVTVQGVQALYAVVVSFHGRPFPRSLGTIFLPIATLGLFRLPAALWLFDDAGSPHRALYATLPSSEPSTPTPVPDCESESENRLELELERFPHNSVRGILVRLYFALQMLGLFGLTLTHTAGYHYSLSYLLQNILFCFLAGITVGVIF
ncbi:uncharacterized protein K452DRAFT_334621 [Aplosporella prunicola CBS 121167]|uniref:Uncharacterized protein n=1 Tax=Aplosporella prunicola CBS 121167 TaxID=1176127 RepID=A0A6A6BBW2_9PEZI|nr:uncharacterized protein K452DRAFT_334621 [Aplosporella prunicola CBS 121167]KAF2141098.1 hypothetical protein K452DRAFT_334621 [Aplosporella prunicola CBS 121167]